MDVIERVFMTDSVDKPDTITHAAYLAALSAIDQIQTRLQWSEIAYLVLNLFIFFPAVFFVTGVFNKDIRLIHYFDILFCLCAFTIGIILNTYWTISSIRLQLKLKLKYFHARNLERALNRAEISFISDEAHYFNPEIGKVESADGKETISYPNQGMLRMDGIIGSAKPRTLSLMIPLVFYIIYIASFYSILSFSLQYIL
jgi:hypothetical protein